MDEEAVAAARQEKGGFHQKTACPEGAEGAPATKTWVLLAGAGGALLPLDFDSPVTERVRFLDQLLLTARIFLEVRLYAEQQPFVGQRLVIVRLQFDGLVDRLVAGRHELDLVGLRRREVA